MARFSRTLCRCTSVSYAELHVYGAHKRGVLLKHDLHTTNQSEFRYPLCLHATCRQVFACWHHLTTPHLEPSFHWLWLVTAELCPFWQRDHRHMKVPNLYQQAADASQVADIAPAECGMAYSWAPSLLQVEKKRWEELSAHVDWQRDVLQTTNMSNE